MAIKHKFKVIMMALPLAVFGGLSTLSNADGLSDAQIVGIYAQVNSFDIETALLGLSKGCSKTVKNLTKHLSTDHMAVRKGILELAEKEGIDYVLPPSRVDAQKSHNNTMAELSSLSCPEFDKAFLKHDVAFHIGAIEAVRTTLIPNTKNAALKAHFEAVLPAFEAHLNMAKDAAAGKSVSHNDH